MTTRNRPPGGRDSHTRNVVMITPGLWADLPQYEVDMTIDGVTVHAVLDWDERQELYIDSVRIDRADGVITPKVLRSITVPALAATGESPVRFYVDEAGTTPYDEQRWASETLEQWAARIFWTCVITRKSPAEEIARIQGITVGSAHQRLTVARKMGLLENERVRDEARKATRKKGRH
jgi:hypothetical protein